MEYARWENFNKVLEKAKEACGNNYINVQDHFRDVTKMIDIAKGAKREIEGVELSRYACYLIVQNADLRKKLWHWGKPILRYKPGVRNCKMSLINLMKVQNVYLSVKKFGSIINHWLKRQKWLE